MESGKDIAKNLATNKPKKEYIYTPEESLELNKRADVVALGITKYEEEKARKEIEEQKRLEEEETFKKKQEELQQDKANQERLEKIYDEEVSNILKEMAKAKKEAEENNKPCKFNLKKELEKTTVVPIDNILSADGRIIGKRLQEREIYNKNIDYSSNLAEESAKRRYRTGVNAPLDIKEKVNEGLNRYRKQEEEKKNEKGFFKRAYR